MTTATNTTTPETTTTPAASFSSFKVDELRDYVRNQKLATGTRVVMAKKQELLDLIEGRITELPTLEVVEIDLNKATQEPVKGEKPVAPTTKPVAEPVTKPVAEPVTKPIDLAATIAAAVQDFIQPVTSEIDEARVIELVKKHAKIEKKVTHIHINKNKTVKIEEHTHECFEQVLKLVSLGLPVLLVGPAGTGKTTLAGQIAKALDRRFSYNSMSAGCSESHLIGRTLPDKDGEWKYKPSPFVTSYKDGGVHLFDEIDAADPNLMVIINSALSNGHLSIPFEDTVVDQHKDAVIIAAANTFGTGASRQYIGRNALDAATLDRFSVSTIEMGYDENLEKKLVKEILDDKALALAVIAGCRKVRHNIEKAGLRRIMSTRTIVNIARRVAIGDGLEDILASYFAGWSKDELTRVGR